jgi:hypothetical protein
MRKQLLVGCILLVVLGLSLSGCSKSNVLATPEPISSPPGSYPTWTQGPPPPSGIGGWQQPRALTEDEKARVVQIALNSPKTSDWLQGRTDYRVAPVDWYAIVWEDGKPETWWASGYEIVDEGIPAYISPYALWYPGVTIAVGQGTIMQMQIAVDLDAGKAVMEDGPYPSLNSPDRFGGGSPSP